MAVQALNDRGVVIARMLLGLQNRIPKLRRGKAHGIRE